MKLTYKHDDPDDAQGDGSVSDTPASPNEAATFRTPVDPSLVRGVDGKLYPRGVDPRSRRSLRRRWKWTIVGLAALLALTLIPLGGWYMLSQAPANYTAYREQIRKSDPREIQAIASALQNAVLGDLAKDFADTSAASTSNIADDLNPANMASRTQIINGMKVQDLGKDKQGRSIRRIELGSEQVNAWLAASFSDWLEYRDFDMPKEIRSPMMAVANGKTTLFFTFESESFSQVFQAEFDLVMDDKGMATIKMDRMQAGRVPVPVDAVGGLVGKAAGQNGTAERASQWIGKIQNYTFKPAMKLPDGLKAQIIEYKAQGDKLILSLQIERYRPSTQKPKVASTESEPTPAATSAAITQASKSKTSEQSPAAAAQAIANVTAAQDE